MRARTTRLKALSVVIGQFSVTAVDVRAHTATSRPVGWSTGSSRGSGSPLPPQCRAAWGLGLAVGRGSAPSPVYDPGEPVCERELRRTGVESGHAASERTDL